MRKQKSHPEYRTNRKRDEKRMQEGEGRGGTQGREEQKGKAEVVPLHRQEKPGKDQKPSLQVFTQASVDIPRGNTVERLPGISIEPEGDQATPGKPRNVVFKVIHRSPDEGSSPEGSDGEGGDGGSSGGDGGEGFAAGTDWSGGPKEDEVRRGSQIRVDGEEHTSSHPPSPAGYAEEGNHSSVQDPEHPEENLRHEQDGEKKSKTSQNPTSRSESKHSAVGGTEGGAEEEPLPGYMPEVVWKEVAIGDHLEEDASDDGEAGRFLQEAEERLRQHDLRQRIMDK